MENNIFNFIPKNVATTLTIFLMTLIVGQFFSISNEIKRGRYIGQEFERIHTITVSGEGRVLKVPDLAEATISVVSKNLNLKAAQQENTAKADAIIKFLKEQNIKAEDIKTISYNIYPQYDYSQYGRKFLGYEIRNSINVKIRDFEKIGLIFDKAVKLGANEVSGLNFTIDKKEEAQKEARQKAIENAKQNAKALAEELNVILVRITNFSESGGYDYPQPLSVYKEMAGASSETPQIEAGQNEIIYKVSITYEIVSR